ncbi:MAG: hypothetical protein ABIS50_21580 [Luteolibacter sp.]|uniref:hypothetical protein n=1 Tax=Luteolibacter sp. TaxID=1962973 RepID=UPI0032678710
MRFSVLAPNFGSQLKFNFVESALVIVTARDVRIPHNLAVPAKGEMVECRYPCAFLESGSIHQPVYQARRCDIAARYCG